MTLCISRVLILISRGTKTFQTKRGFLSLLLVTLVLAAFLPALADAVRTPTSEPSAPDSAKPRTSLPGQPLSDPTGNCQRCGRVVGEIDFTLPLNVANGQLANIALDTANGDLYLSTGPGYLEVLSTTTDSVTGTIQVGGNSGYLLYSPSNGRLYAANNGYISVIDPTLGKVVANITTNAQSTTPKMVFDSANNELYALSDGQAKTVLAINGETDALMANMTLHTYQSGLSLALDNKTNTLYAAAGLNIAVISTATNAIVANITMPWLWNGGTENLFYDPLNQDLYVGSPGENGFAIVNTVTNQLIPGGLMGAGYNVGFVLDPQNGEVFAVNNPYLYVLNGGTNAFTTTLTVGGTAGLGMVFDPADGYLYVGSGSETISVVDPQANAVIGTIVIGLYGAELVYDPTNQDIYAVASSWGPGESNGLSLGCPVGCYNYVAVISGGGPSDVTAVPVNDNPGQIVYDPSNHDLYVAITGVGEESIQVIDTLTQTLVATIGAGCNGGVYPYTTGLCSPSAIAYDPVNNDIYVAGLNYSYGSIVLVAIDGSTNKITKDIGLGIGMNGIPSEIVVDTTNGDLYAADLYAPSGGGTVTIVNGATNSLVTNLLLTKSQSVNAIAFDQQDGDLYAVAATEYNPSCASTGRLLVINGATNAIVANESAGPSPTDIAYDSSNGNLYFSDACSYPISEVSGATNQVVANLTATVRGSYERLLYDSFNHYLYGFTGAAMAIVDPSSDSVVATLPIGTESAYAVDPSNGDVFAGYTYDSVSIVGGSTNSVLLNARVGSSPGFIAFDQANGDAYVSVPGANIVYVLPDSLSSGASAVVAVTCNPKQVAINSTAHCAARVTGLDPTGPMEMNAAPLSSDGLVNPNQCELTNGSCSFTVRNTDLGAGIVTATYLGDSNNLAFSGTVTLVVTPTNTTTTVICSPATTKGGTTCVAKVVGYQPTGTVTWSTNSSSGAFSPSECPGLSSSGQCIAIYNDTTTKVVSITASYSGDTDNLQSAGSFLLNVPIITTTMGTTTSSFVTVVPGTPVTDSVTVAALSALAGTPTGNVQFYLCFSASSASPCATSAGNVFGQPVTLSGGSATSVAVSGSSTPVKDEAAGFYCWSAVYTPDSSKYAGSEATAGISECFGVAGSATTPAALTLGGVWATLAPMPTARMHPFVAEVGGKLYVAGGLISSSGPVTGVLEIYDPSTNTWAVGASMPTPAYATGPDGQAVALDGKIYFLGGQPVTCCGVETNAVQVYDPGTNTWTLAASLPKPLDYMAVGAINGKIYVAGGVSQGPGGIAVSSLYIYDPTSNTWSNGASLPVPNAAGLGMAYNDTLYVVGGGVVGCLPSCPYFTSVNVYNLSASSWSAASPLPVGRQSAYGGVIGSSLYAVSGYTTSGFVLSMSVYNFVTNSWSSGPPMPILQPYADSVVSGNTLYVVGGSISGSASKLLQAFTPESVAIQTSGDISPAQFSAVQLTFNSSASSYTLSFILTGPSGSAGSTTVTIPKAQVPDGYVPVVYINGTAASSQSYTQDATNYYVTFSIHFSTHFVQILLTEATNTTTTSSASSASTTTTPTVATETSSVVPIWAYGAMAALLIAGLAIGYVIRRPPRRRP